MGLFGSQKTIKPQQFDPLFPGSGGDEIRDNIFGRLPSLMNQSQNDASTASRAAQNAASSFAPLQAYAQNALGGQYLNRSPQLNNAMADARKQTQNALQASRTASDVGAQNQYGNARASLGDQQRRFRSQFARTGQTFGTGMGQAQDSSNVALNSQIARNEASRQAQLAANENQIMASLSDRNLALEAARLQQERQLQQQAGNISAMANTKPFEILSAVPGMRYGGLNESASLATALAGGGQVVNPGSYYKPGAIDYGLQIGSLFV